jgi:formylmethanofuran dehydrogenase subunit C
MRRGTIAVGGRASELSPAFIESGAHALVALRLMARFVQNHSERAAAVLDSNARRLMGDMAVLGKGELFVREN